MRLYTPLLYSVQDVYTLNGMSENTGLRRENDYLRQQRDILKKTLGILSEPLTSGFNGSTR